MSTYTTLYINPSYCVSTDCTGRKSRSILQRLSSSINLESNEYKNKVSKQSIRKIRNAVQWLVFLAREKNVFSKFHNKSFKYRAGLVTVSLPTLSEGVSPEFFRKSLLEAIISAMKYKFGLENYIWKLERQGNGNLHAHITVDEFIPFDWLRDTWCRLLDKHSLLSEYVERFQSMSCREYIQYRRDSDSVNVRLRYSSELGYVKSLIKAYNFGRDSGWTKPNCTDVHSVKNVKELSAYMAKYLSKDPQLGDDFKGRYWSASYSISRLRMSKITIDETGKEEIWRDCAEISESQTDLFFFSTSRMEPVNYASLSFFKRSRRLLYNSKIIGAVFRVIFKYYHSKVSKGPPLFTYSGPAGLQFSFT